MLRGESYDEKRARDSEVPLDEVEPLSDDA